ncbi:conserved hypothetical protein [Histoplasma capsulatum var. duboisii H88]|uniref:Protein kinase domain-containing protein n=3 Tax=Ajellomyces capsulatus TaxID=5037 RepID=F0UDW9_AJEC8|nr:conserved hypothetical protein [Histoplasma capsulatum H143]EGC45330.1 conserved hypothetical protein [Histoplasma capsulatum var. duboisii H88]
MHIKILRSIVTTCKEEMEHFQIIKYEMKNAIIMRQNSFMHEVEMQKLFKDDQMIRPMVDFVPSSEPGGPLMILKPFEQTLWEARNTRPFSVPEIKWIMKGVLLGLYTVHIKDLVYTDLKMENVGMQGFENDRPNENIRNLIVRLSDCGPISKPSQREVTSLTYRSPEIHFGKPWSQSCDIWSWGIILAQLFLARVDFKKPGMYDNISAGSLEEKAKAIRDALAIDFNLHSVPYYAQDERISKLLPQPQPDTAYMWANSMFESGVAAEAQILETGYLEESNSLCS